MIEYAERSWPGITIRASGWINEANKSVKSGPYLELDDLVKRFHLGKHKGTARCADPFRIEYLLQDDL